MKRILTVIVFLLVTIPSFVSAQTISFEVTYHLTANGVPGNRTRVDFYADNELIGTDTRAPYDLFTTKTPVQFCIQVGLVKNCKLRVEQIPVDATCSSYVISAAGNWSACVNNSQSRIETWLRTTLTAPAYGGKTCDPLTKTITTTQACQTPVAEWSLVATPPTIQAGESVTLNYVTPILAADFHNVFINQSRPTIICNPNCIGSLTVSPVVTTTYTLMSENLSGQRYPDKTIIVTVSGTAPIPVSINLLYPIPGTLIAPANIGFTAQVNNMPAGTAVEFLSGSTILATVLKEPFEFLWINVPANVYNVCARILGSVGVCN